MFLWIIVDLKQHRRFQSTVSAEMGELRWDVEERIYAETLRRGTQITKGSLVEIEKGVEPVIHFRLTYAAAGEENLDRGVRMFADALKEEFGPSDACNL